MTDKIVQSRFEYATHPGVMSDWDTINPDNPVYTHSLYNIISLLENQPTGTILRRIIPQTIGRDTIHEWRLAEPEPEEPDLLDLLINPNDLRDHLKDIEEAIDEFARQHKDGDILLENTNMILGAIEDMFDTVKSAYGEAQQEWQGYKHLYKQWEKRNA